MTAQKAQIESLIQEIDEILDKTAPRLPWLMPNDAVKQRQVLEQTRRYLASLQAGQPQSSEVSFNLSADLSPDRPERSETAAAPIPQAVPQAVPQITSAARPVLPPESAASAPAQAEVVESAQQALQAVVQEMNYLRSNLLQPMRSDVDVLRQQRETLLQEVRQLEAQRQQYALPQQNQLLMEFLQAAFRQMQENLSAQVAQMMTTLPAQPSGALPEGAANLPPMSLTSSDLMALSPAQRLEQIQRVQSQSDQLLLKLDSSLRIIFNSLQQNVQTYQDSLEQGLSRMHNLGQQGEAMFAALVTRLAEQLGREASTFLQSSIEPAPWEPALPLEERSAVAPPAPSTPSAGQAGSSAAESDISRLLDELNELDAVQPAPPSNPFAVDAQRSDAESLNSLDLLDLELQQLDLDAITPEPFAIVDEDLTVFQEGPLDNFLSTDLTVLQDDSEPEVLEPIAAEAGATQNPIPADDASEVLDLLNQLDVEVQDDARTEPPSGVSFGEISGVSSETIVPRAFEESDAFSETFSPPEPPLVASPDNLYEDAFYQSLFGEAQPLNPEDLFAEIEPDRELAAVPEETAAVETEALAAESANFTDLLETDLTEMSLSDPLSDPLSDAVQIDWFSGFPEEAVPAELSAELLAERPEELPVELTIVEAPELPQTVENVLLPTTDLQPPLPLDLSRSTLTPAIDEPVNLPVNPPANLSEESAPAAFSADIPTDIPADIPVDSAPTAESAIETVSSLLDLIPFPASSNPPATNGMTLETVPDEQAFELAQPGEDLLAEEPAQPDVLLNLRLSADTLEQLSQDLSSLEGGEDFAIADAADWMLPDAPPEPLPLTDFFDEPIAPAEVVGPAVEQGGGPVVGRSEDPIEDLLADYSDPLVAIPDSPPAAEDLFAADLDSSAVTDDLFADYPDVPAQASDAAIAPSEESPAEWDLFDFDAIPEPSAEATANALNNALNRDAFALDFAEGNTGDRPDDDRADTDLDNSAGNAAGHLLDSNAFTLEGLESLFENLPSIDSPNLTGSTDQLTDQLTDQFLDAFHESEFAESAFEGAELHSAERQPSLQTSSPDRAIAQEGAEKKKS